MTRAFSVQSRDAAGPEENQRTLNGAGCVVRVKFKCEVVPGNPKQFAGIIANAIARRCLPLRAGCS
jgi:hypothetical protein